MTTFIVLDAESSSDLEIILNHHQDAKIVAFQHQVWFEDWEDQHGDNHERHERYTVIMEDDSQ